MDLAVEPTADYELDKELERLRRDGSLARVKLGMVFENVIIPWFVTCLRNPEVPVSAKLQIVDRVTKLGNLEPRPEMAGLSGGSQFGVVINLPGGGGSVSIAGQTGIALGSTSDVIDGAAALGPRPRWADALPVEELCSGVSP